MDIIVFIALFAALVAALGRHHCRTFLLPRAPFGADAELDRDIDRVLHDAPSPTTRASPTDPPDAPADIGSPAGPYSTRPDTPSA